MTTSKRKPSYEQALALERGQAVRRRNQRAASAEREQPAPAEHVHAYGDWTCRGAVGMNERRYCECGSFEQRAIRPL